MFGSKTITADVTNATAVYASAAALSFRVEEEEMLCALAFDAVVSSNTVGEGVELNFLVDGALLDAAKPLTAATSSTVDALNSVRLTRIVRLSKGEHTVAAQLRRTAGASIAKVAATAYPAVLSALRHSHAQTLAHGTDSKVQATF